MKDVSLRLEVIYWHDAYYCGDTQASKNRDRLVEPLITTGWYLREDDEGVQIAGELSTDKTSCRHVVAIPKAMILWRSHRQIRVQVEDE